MAEDVRAVNSQKIKKSSLLIGILVTVFALIGFVIVAIGVVRGISAGLNSTAKYDEYKSFLAPVVMNDPDPFDDVTNADESQLISIAVWAILEGDTAGKYVDTEKGIPVPKEDVEKKFAELFGRDIVPEHRTVNAGSGISFEYSRESGIYYVPVTGIEPLYSPSIVDVNRKGSTIILTVGYLSTSLWSVDSKGEAIPPEPTKFVRITLRSDGEKGYYISSMKAADAPETAVVEDTTAKPTTEKVTEKATTEKVTEETTVKEKETEKTTKQNNKNKKDKKNKGDKSDG